jgi:hypothetical protein
MIVGSFDKFEISVLIFQIHFPPLSLLRKADNCRCSSHCPLCFVILGKVSLGKFAEERPRHPQRRGLSMMFWEAVYLPECLDEFLKYFPSSECAKIPPSLFLPDDPFRFSASGTLVNPHKLLFITQNIIFLFFI